MLPVILPPNLYEAAHPAYSALEANSTKQRSMRRILRNKKNGNQSLDMSLDATIKKALVHIPDLNPRDKITNKGAQVASVYTEQVQHLNRLIGQEKFRLEYGSQIAARKSNDFLTGLPEGLDFAKDKEKEKEKEREQERGQVE